VQSSRGAGLSVSSCNCELLSKSDDRIGLTHCLVLSHSENDRSATEGSVPSRAANRSAFPAVCGRRRRGGGRPRRSLWRGSRPHGSKKQYVMQELPVGGEMSSTSKAVVSSLLCCVLLPSLACPQAVVNKQDIVRKAMEAY
jgi:hypothetical protein